MYRSSDCRTAAPHSARDVFLRCTELFDETDVSGGFLEGGEIFSLEVLDQRDLERFAIVHLADDGRHGLEPGESCGA